MSCLISVRLSPLTFCSDSLSPRSRRFTQRHHHRPNSFPTSTRGKRYHLKTSPRVQRIISRRKSSPLHWIWQVHWRCGRCHVTTQLSRSGTLSSAPITLSMRVTMSATTLSLQRLLWVLFPFYSHGYPGLTSNPWSILLVLRCPWWTRDLVLLFTPV